MKGYQMMPLQERILIKMIPLQEIIPDKTTCLQEEIPGTVRTYFQMHFIYFPTLTLTLMFPGKGNPDAHHVIPRHQMKEGGRRLRPLP
jgi:hypothetical protein